MNYSKERLAVLAIAAFALATVGLSTPAIATSPTTPNCLGQDVSSFTKIAPGFVGSVASSLSSGGFDNEILAHLQGIPGISSCPDNGFPTPLH
ncbi:MAG: hypothetical protein HY297_05125 [Thaumarchaeota archaeon]|nr:hypothetical protein [Nitrososphaerota archaeon]